MGDNQARCLYDAYHRNVGCHDLLTRASLDQLLALSHPATLGRHAPRNIHRRTNFSYGVRGHHTIVVERGDDPVPVARVVGIVAGSVADK